MSDILIHASITGTPEPAGSPKIITRNARPFVIWQKGPKWTKAVHKAVTQLWTEPLLDEPVLVNLRFWLPKPKKPKFPWVPGTRPDLDKLIRSTLDGLQGSILTEDSRVVGVTATKWYATDEHPAGAEVIVLSA